MNKIICFFMLILLLTRPCASQNQNQDQEKNTSNSQKAYLTDAQNVVDQICHFQNSKPLCKVTGQSLDAQITGDLLDVQEYFKILKHLSMEPGYVLEYVYLYVGLGAYPLLYARKKEEIPFKSANHLLESRPDLPFNFFEIKYFEEFYLSRIQTDKTPQGYFELALFKKIGFQFYLIWHAEYLKSTVLCNKTAASQNIPGEIHEKMEKLDFTPKVYIESAKVTVQFLYFNKWKGIVRSTFIMNREFPHTPVEEKENVLVRYHCGYDF